jgi:hypothetical protein
LQNTIGYRRDILLHSFGHADVAGDALWYRCERLFIPPARPISSLLEPISKSLSLEKAVMPAKAGIQKSLKTLESRLHGNDDKRSE